MNNSSFDAEKIAPASTTVTGRAVAEAAASDFMLFFFPGNAFEVRVTVGSVNFPCARKDNMGSYIVIPTEMAEELISTPELLLFHLLMIGHEIAHLVHRHLDGASAQSDDDYRSLELWADFYGTKVAMALLTYGTQLHPIAKRFWPDGDLDKLLLDLGRAVGLLVSTVYREHRKYPAKLERAGLISNGVTSFLRASYGARFDPRLYYSIHKRIFSDPSVQELVLLDGGCTKFDDAPIMASVNWHRNAQGAATSITPGFLPHMLNYLHTTFDQTNEQIAELRRVRIEELKRAGLLDDVDATSPVESS